MNGTVNALKNKIKEFQNKEVCIEIEDAIQYQLIIKDSKIILSNQKLIISDEDKNDFIVELHYLDNTKIEENTIKLIMYNDLTIIITY